MADLPTANSQQRSAFRIDFVSLEEGVVLLHGVLAAAKKNVPAKVAADRATILNYVSRVQSWSHGKSGCAAAPLSEVEIRQLGLMFQQHWPQALLPDSSSSEDLAADIAAQLSALRVRNPMPGSRLGIAGSFVEVLKKADDSNGWVDFLLSRREVP